MNEKSRNQLATPRWYKVWLVVPGTDGDAENGPCEPLWWTDMEQAPDEETAVQQANNKARRQWEETPSDWNTGQKCPVCTGATAITEEEYTAWKREQDEIP